MNSICKHGASDTLCGLLWKNVVSNPDTSYFVSVESADS